jgi:hypothetical protein
MIRRRDFHAVVPPDVEQGGDAFVQLFARRGPLVRRFVRSMHGRARASTGAALAGGIASTSGASCSPRRPASRGGQHRAGGGYRRQLARSRLAPHRQRAPS